MEQFGDRQVGDLVIDRCAEEDDPLVEQARVDVEGALAVHGLLDHHRNQRAHRRSPCCGCTRSFAFSRQPDTCRSSHFSPACPELERDRLRAICSRPRSTS
jgi:hypothetical protein